MQSPPRIGAVVLAAGASTRFGSPKQLLTLDGLPLVRRAASAAVDAGAYPVVVVIGADATLVAPALSGLKSVRTVVNHNWASGLASSLVTGLHSLFDGATLDGVLVTLADQPHVDAAALRILLAVFGSENRIVAATYQNTIGVPAVFGREHVAGLMNLTGDTGAGQWLRSHASEVKCIPLGDAALDIDTPSDVVRLETGGLLLAPAPDDA